MKIQHLFGVLTLALCSVSTGAAEAEVPSLPALAKTPQFQAVKISPDGHYFAAKIQKDDGHTSLVVLDRHNKLKVVSVMNFTGNDTLVGFDWANNERLLMQPGRFVGALEQPYGTGELFAMNVDGSQKEMLFGMRAKRKAMRASARVIDWLKDDPKHVLIATQPFGFRDAFYPTVYKLNLYGGKLSKVTKPPVRGGGVLTDSDGQVRFAVGADLDNNNQTLVAYRDKNGDDWRIIERFDESQGGFLPLTFINDNQQVLGLSDHGADTKGLVLLDPKSGEKSLVYRDKDVDVSPVFDFNNGQQGKVIGVSFEKTLPQRVFLKSAEKDPFAADLVALEQAFSGRQVSLTSTTRDGQLMVAVVWSDTQPSQFYLFDRQHKRLTYLLSAMPWLQASQLAHTQAYSYKARDGQLIHGYLTLPPGKHKNLPLVMMPHGGPHGIRDNWGYDPYIQVLATRGYAVFQPNFRGSGGYGKAFQQAGYRHWGTLMIDDMTDGVQQLIKDGTVDKNRICSFGGSYGGYAAVMSAEREPELYKCAIGYVGVYDLQLLYDKPGAYSGRGSENFRKNVLGEDKARLKAQSPAFHVDKLAGPVLIVAGGEDQIAPIAHSEALRDAMQKAGKPYQWYVEPQEGHGFYNPEHKVTLFNKMLTFLDQNIGH